MGAFLTSRFRFGYISGDFHHSGIHIYIEQLLIELFTENSHNALAQWGYREIEKLGIIAIERESDFRMDKGDTFKLSKDITQFGRIRFQELTAGRHVEE